MVELRPTTDVRYILSVLEHEDVKPWITDDVTVNLPIDLNKIVQPGNIFLHVRNDGVDAGMFILIKKTSNIYEVHTCLLKNARGKYAYSAARLLYEYTFTYTEATIISSFCLSTAPHTMAFAKANWMEEDGTFEYENTVGGLKVTLTKLSITIHVWARQIGRIKRLRAAQEMVRCGLTTKAASFFSYWGLNDFGKYMSPIDILSEQV